MRYRIVNNHHHSYLSIGDECMLVFDDETDRKQYRMLTGDKKPYSFWLYDTEVEEIKMNCKEKGWKVDDVFVVKEDAGYFAADEILVLTRDDDSDCPLFRSVYGERKGESHYANLDAVKFLYSPNKKGQIVLDGKEFEISRELYEEVKSLIEKASKQFKEE